MSVHVGWVSQGRGCRCGWRMMLVVVVVATEEEAEVVIPTSDCSPPASHNTSAE